MDSEHSTGTRSNSPRIATLTRWRSQLVLDKHLTIAAGLSGARKSFVGISMALCVAQGNAPADVRAWIAANNPPAERTAAKE